jgi:hypothetical protein
MQIYVIKNLKLLVIGYLCKVNPIKLLLQHIFLILIKKRKFFNSTLQPKIMKIFFCKHFFN